MADVPPDVDAALWLAKADDDLLVVDILVGADGPAGIACFHCQQAVEKYLKACLSAAGAIPPKVHDLEYLYDLLIRAGVDLALDRDLLAGLRPYAVAPRYPGFGDEHSRRDLPRMHELARAVGVAVRLRLSGPDAGRRE